METEKDKDKGKNQTNKEQKRKGKNWIKSKGQPRIRAWQLNLSRKQYWKELLEDMKVLKGSPIRQRCQIETNGGAFKREGGGRRHKTESNNRFERR